MTTTDIIQSFKREIAARGEATNDQSEKESFRKIWKVCDDLYRYACGVDRKWGSTSVELREMCMEVIRLKSYEWQKEVIAETLNANVVHYRFIGLHTLRDCLKEVVEYEKLKECA